jgi:hypothetical protein
MEQPKRAAHSADLALTPGALPSPPLPNTNLFVWGCNSNAQLGHAGGDRVSATLAKCAAFFSHVAAGTSHTVAITASGVVPPPPPPSMTTDMLDQHAHPLRFFLGATTTAANSAAPPPPPPCRSPLMPLLTRRVTAQKNPTLHQTIFPLEL